MVKSNVEKTAAERSDYSSLYRGVRKRKWGKYVSEIRLPNSRQRIWLGSYDSAVKAARAFDAAMFCLRGSGAKFNFPNDPPDIAGGRSMTHSQIKAAATRFANSGQPDNEYSGWSVTETPSSSEGAAVLLPMESPTRQIYRDYDSKELFLDLFSKTGSGYSMSPCFYDFGGDFYVPELTNFDYEEENMDGLIIQDSFLWNF